MEDGRCNSSLLSCNKLPQTEWLQATHVIVFISLGQEIGRSLTGLPARGSQKLQAVVKLMAGLCSHPEAGGAGVCFPAESISRQP